MGWVDQSDTDDRTGTKEHAIIDAAKALAHWHSDAAPHIIRVAELRRWLLAGGTADQVLVDRMEHSIAQLEHAAEVFQGLVSDLATAVGAPADTNG